MQKDAVPSRPSIRNTYRYYLSSARAHERAGRIDAAWACLEAAHIVGQRSTRLHVGSHAAMLGLAWRSRSLRELFAQAARLIAATVATWIGCPWETADERTFPHSRACRCRAIWNGWQRGPRSTHASSVEFVTLSPSAASGRLASRILRLQCQSSFRQTSDDEKYKSSLAVRRVSSF